MTQPLMTVSNVMSSPSLGLDKRGHPADRCAFHKEAISSCFIEALHSAMGGLTWLLFRGDLVMLHRGLALPLPADGRLASIRVSQPAQRIEQQERQRAEAQAPESIVDIFPSEAPFQNPATPRLRTRREEQAFGDHGDPGDDPERLIPQLLRRDDQHDPETGCQSFPPQD